MQYISYINLYTIRIVGLKEMDIFKLVADGGMLCSCKRFRLIRVPFLGCFLCEALDGATRIKDEMLEINQIEKVWETRHLIMAT